VSLNGTLPNISAKSICKLLKFIDNTASIYEKRFYERFYKIYLQFKILLKVKSRAMKIHENESPIKAPTSIYKASH